MKFIHLILFISFYQAHLQQDLLDISITIEKRLKQILYADTTYNDSTSIQTIRYYDNNNKLTKLVRTNIHMSHAIFGPRTEVYNENELIILEQVQDYKGVIWHRYVYEYDERNNLISKEGFSSGELGHRIEYKYDEYGVLIEQTEIKNGKTVNRKRVE
ncbi:MAG: hypothetical protein N4A72_21000 [Bacteroidales bacterium]|jgi:muramoyltetrapeptide carboxypeptidase LdcA involved in peptidoglycan recycling|nr:hypothetical protein [Bacteroidales bacterium]